MTPEADTDPDPASNDMTALGAHRHPVDRRLCEFFDAVQMGPCVARQVGQGAVAGDVAPRGRALSRSWGHAAEGVGVGRELARAAALVGAALDPDADLGQGVELGHRERGQTVSRARRSKPARRRTSRTATAAPNSPASFRMRSSISGSKPDGRGPLPTPVA